jgi:hypothetical protein
MLKMNKSELKKKLKKLLMKKGNAKNSSKLHKRKKLGKNDWENLRKTFRKMQIRKKRLQKYKRE